jgi:ABC-2 type transport system permease protein
MRLIVVFKAITRNWLRSRAGLFFSFLFPVFFLLLFGSILSGSSSSVTLTVQNNDVVNGVPTALSQQFIASLQATQVLKVSQPSIANVTDYIQAQASTFGGDPRLLIIPQGFATNVSGGIPVQVTFISSPSDQLAAQIQGLVQSVSTAFNFEAAHAQPVVSIGLQPTSARPLTQIDYYMPGLIGAFMMTNGVIGLTSIASEMKRSGLTKRLSGTPLTKLEWMVGNVLSQTVLAVILAAVMMVLGVLVYHTSVTIDSSVVALVVAGAVLFSGIGMTLAGLVSDPEAAAGLGNAIAFPMMFLSGTFFPVSIMPAVLQNFASILPLTYFSEGLRDAMVVGNTPAALENLGIIGILAVAFILIGARVTRWEEE